MFIKAKQRTSDSYGSGKFGASRGSRKHKGVDLCCAPNSVICSHINGQVTKIGYPYADDLSFRYVQITDYQGLDHRFFYVEPSVKVGQLINLYDEIGTSQILSIRYPKTALKPVPIQEHVHYEVVSKNSESKEYLDPNLFLVGE